MIEITSTELRNNIGKYFELAIQKNEPVLVRYRNNKVYSLTLETISSDTSRKTERDDNSYEQPEVIESIRRSRADIKAGRVRKFTDIKSLWENIP